MKKATALGLAASLLLGGTALAQTGTANPPPSATTAPGTTGMSSGAMGTGAAGTGTNGGPVMSRSATPGAMSGSTGAGSMSGQNAAGGNDNQAVATTDANAAQPASGANSFTMRQAAARLHKDGYTKVTGLKKDSHGVWRGQAQKDGAPVSVWLDYKGNAGQS